MISKNHSYSVRLSWREDDSYLVRIKIEKPFANNVMPLAKLHFVTN